MKNSKLLLIGFCPLNERMYPHLYDVIKLLETKFDVDYLDGDDRGQGLAAASSALHNSQILFGFKLLCKDVFRRILLQRVIKSKFSANNYSVVIAIDHTALNLVSKYISGATKLVFWSLDFIAKDSDWYKSFLIRRVIHYNKINAKKINMLVAQDKNRLAIVREILDISSNIKEFQLPVALCDDDHAIKISSEKRVIKRLEEPAIIQLTAATTRGSLDLIRKFQTLGTDIALYIHGYVDSQTLSLIENSTRKPTLTPISCSFIEMRNNIAKGDIGFVCYLQNDINHLHIDRSSGQTTEYLRLGIPVIVFGSKLLSSFIEDEGAGLSISSIDELDQSIEQISKSYFNNSSAARRLYEKYFCLEIYSQPFCDALMQRD